MMTDYVPIDCDQHSELELLAMRRARVRVQARGPVGEVLGMAGEVFDLVTRDGAEYLVLREPHGETRSVRLDHLLGLTSADGATVWRQKNVCT